MARLIVASLALFVAAAVDGLLNVADAVADGVRTALTFMPPVTDGGITIMHVCGAYSDTIRGHQMAILLFLLGGPPCALIGAALERRQLDGRRWRADCSAYLHAGLVFQLCAFGLSAFLFIVLTVAAAVIEPAALVNPAAAILLLVAACNVWGISSWRAIQHDVEIVTLALT